MKPAAMVVFTENFAPENAGNGRMMKYLSGLVAAILGSGSVFADWTSEPVDFDRTPLHYVWPGPDQSVYAGGGSTENQLLRWNGSGWELLTPISGRIHFGFTSKDGTVWFLTRDNFRSHVGNIQGLWRWEPGAESPEPVKGFDPESFTIRVSSVHFHAAVDKQGRIILTSRSKEIYVIEEGRFREWYTVGAQETSGGDQERSSGGYLYPTRLSDGRIVVVGYGPSNGNVFYGYLVIDDLQVQTHPLPEVNQPDFYYSQLSVLRPDPRGPIYQSARGRILLLDIEAHEFRELADFSASANRGYLRFWEQDGDDAWALFMRYRNQSNETSQNQIQLWRRIGNGAWEPFSDWIDYGTNTGRWSNSSEVPTAYPFLSTDNAVWIGTRDLGVIRVDRKSGDYLTLNWRHEFTLNDASWLLPLPDDWVWVGGVNDFQGSGSFDSKTVRTRDQPDDRILSFPPLTGTTRWPSTQTSDGTVYELRIISGETKDRSILRKWTGQSWENLTFEELTGHPLMHVLLTDRDDRIWVVETHREKVHSRRAVIIDVTTGKQVISGEFKDLLASYAQDGQNPGFHPGFDNTHNMFFPYISPQGYVLYLDHNDLIVYNGESWGSIRPNDISENYPDYRPTRFGYTKDTGHAAVRIERKIYKLEENGKWKATDAPFVRVDGRRTLRELKPGQHLHQSVVESFGFSAASRVWDLGEGRYWTHTDDARAYLCYESWTTEVTPGGGASPLPLVENLSAYYNTGTGQHMLRVGQGWLVFPAPKPGTPPQVTTTRPSPDRVLLEVSKAGNVTAWRWRLNGGPWSEPARHKWLEISNLLPGHHRVDLQALSQGLAWMDRQTVEFEIEYDLQLVLANALSDLISEDWDRRNLAVRRLAIAPEEAATLLQSVEADALSEVDRWWLEAALQNLRRTESVANQMQPRTKAP